MPKKSSVHLVDHEECTILRTSPTRWNSYCRAL